MTKHNQARFHNGRLIATETQSDSSAETKRTTPGNGTGFTVEVKPGALDANAVVQDDIDDYDNPFEFDSRATATTYIKEVSAMSGDLKLQAVAPNDPADIDAYLLADHSPSIKEPADVSNNTLTFDIGANLYGTLGEALLTAPPKPHALIYFVKQDLDIDDATLEHDIRVDVETDCPFISTETNNGTTHRWCPDCKLIARDGWTGPVLETYYCEIKTGNASFQRSQTPAMNTLAETERVLKIRVLIEDLPDQYSIRIHEV